MTEIKKTLAIIKARWPEAILILGILAIWQWPRAHDRLEPQTAADPAMSFRSDIVDNPWQTNSDDTVPANPYVARASDVIDAGLITGVSSIQVQIHQLQRQADRMDREDEFLLTPSLSLDDEVWSEQVTRISKELKRLGPFPTD